MTSISATLCVSLGLTVAGCGGQSATESRPERDVDLAPKALPGTSGPAPLCFLASTPQRAEVWRRSLSLDDPLAETSVATDADGSAFVSRASGETFKIDASGNVVWSKPFGSIVATDRGGNVLVAGDFSGTLELGEGRSLSAKGGADVYVVELTSEGTLEYAVALGGPLDEAVSSLAVGRDGGAVVSGPGLGTSKLDASGRVVWTRDFHGAVAIDSGDNVVTVGTLTGSVSFGGELLESAGGKDIFVAKLDASGEHLFSRRFGDAGPLQYAEAVAITRDDDILVSGVSDGVIDFGGGPISVPVGACPAETWCEQAGFVAKLDPSGSHLWSQSRAPVRSITGLVSDSRGHVLASGAYPGNAPPYRSVLFLELDGNGNELTQAGRLDSSLTSGGVGHRIAVDAWDNVFWSLVISPEPGVSASTLSLLVKLVPSCPGG
jgi:hypothetical protein